MWLWAHQTTISFNDEVILKATRVADYGGDAYVEGSFTASGQHVFWVLGRNSTTQHSLLVSPQGRVLGHKTVLEQCPPKEPRELKSSK